MHELSGQLPFILFLNLYFIMCFGKIKNLIVNCLIIILYSLRFVLF